MPLAADMARIVAAARTRLAQAPRDVLSAVTADLVQHTPVDRGFLRAGWDAAEVATLPNAPDPTGADAIARLGAAAQALPFGGVFTVTNRVNYAPYLEFGTVRIAPRAYLRGTLARAPTVATEVLARGARP